MRDTIELYGALTGNCIRAAMALEEAGLSYAVKRVNLAGAEHQSDEYLALNAFGKVPVLVEHRSDGDFVLAQSNAIMMFAAERSGGRLLPSAPLARARVLERFFYFLTDVIAVNHGAFRLRLMGAGAHAAHINGLARAALERSELFLHASPFMAGDAFSLADIAAFSFASSLGDAFPWEAHPVLARWFEMVAARPGVIDGLAAFA